MADHIRVWNYFSVRRPSELENYLLLSTSAHRPLITLWTASYCPSCKHVAPLISSLITSSSDTANLTLNYCEVEFDSPDNMAEGLGMRYMITGLPTLLAFDERGEVVGSSRCSDVGRLRDRVWVGDWLRREAERGRGSGGGGGGSGRGMDGFTSGGAGGQGTGLFGGLFGWGR